MQRDCIESSRINIGGICMWKQASVLVDQRSKQSRPTNQDPLQVVPNNKT